MSSLVFPLQAVGAVVKSRTPYYDVRVDEAVSGKEARSSWWAAPRYRYAIGFEVVRSDTRQDYQQLASFYARHFGQLDSFLLTDPEDNTVSSMGFGVGDGTTTAFQLQRSHLGSVYDALGGPWQVSSTPRTNYLVQSQSPDNVSWTKGTGVTVTPNAQLAPDGTQTADTITYNGAGTAGGTRLSQNTALTPANGVATSTSVWLKAPSPLTLVLTNNLGQTSTLSITTSWQQFPLSGIGTGALALGLALSSPGGVNTSFTVYFWGGQCEQTSAPTQYIATTTVALTLTPSYWPAYGDGFGPVYDLNPAGNTTIYVNGVAKVLGTDYTLSSTGLVTFTAAPAANAVLTWSGSYYRRVRFADGSLSFQRIVQSMWKSDLQLVSVKP